MQQPATLPTVLPRYADWLTTEAVAALVGVSPILVTTWITTGVKSENGPIRLRAKKVGGRWKIEPSAVSEFIDATTRASLPPSATAPEAQPAPRVESVADRTRRASECMARLQRAGIATDAVPVPTRTRRS